MNLYFFTEARFCKINNEIWAPGPFSMTLWTRYISVFEHVYVVGRVEMSTEPIMNGMVPIKSDKVSFCELPYYIGPLQYLKNKQKIKLIIEKLAIAGNAYICRVPGQIGDMAAKILKRRNIPYAVEVVGDPEEVFSKGAYDSVFSPIFRVISSRSLRDTVSKSSAALYVTNHILQEKYPCKNGFSIGASNVVLKDEHFVSEITASESKLIDKEIRFLAVGTLAQMYKAPDIVLKALAKLKQLGISFHLTWFGDGACRSAMIQLAADLDIDKYVDFPGNVLSNQIREEFLRTDIFLHVSRAEGLPRALIEAMAYGLPAIGTHVSGIPELLASDAIIKVNDIDALVNKVFHFINNPVFVKEQSIRNLATAREYHDDILSKRRIEFFRYIKLISKK